MLKREVNKLVRQGLVLIVKGHKDQNINDFTVFLYNFPLKPSHSRAVHTQTSSGSAKSLPRTVNK